MKRICVAILLSTVACGVAAQDSARGQALYETHCLECHYERIHKRDAARSLVRSYAALQAEVARRAELTRQRFSIAELEDVAEYLNRTHYRFAR
jgi:mono/diheme cytochrome c family protein